MNSPLVLVHGGGGDVPVARQPRHVEGCRAAAHAGGAILADGGSAVDAACAAVAVLEDDPVFNAGTGCALDLDGRPTLDAAVHCGSTGRFGAVAVLPAFRNPVRVAQALLGAREVLLAGEEAARWAVAHGFRRLADRELLTAASLDAWRRVVERGGEPGWAGGTVGAVARDAAGRLAAATSTGGTQGKTPGRVGDTPVPGAGTWADEHAAVSATGDGEALLRAAFAVRLAEALARREGASEAALVRALGDLLERQGGRGGAIVVPRAGGPLALHTTATMSHAWWCPEGEDARAAAPAPTRGGA